MHATNEIDLSDLKHFTGTSVYYKHWRGQLVMTDGVKYLCDNGHAWFIDIIDSVQHKLKLKRDDMQFWQLNVKEGHDVGEAVCKVSDEEGEAYPIYIQSFPTTSPLNGLRVWVKYNVMMLPSEY